MSTDYQKAAGFSAIGKKRDQGANWCQAPSGVDHHMRHKNSSTHKSTRLGRGGHFRCRFRRERPARTKKESERELRPDSFWCLQGIKKMPADF